MKMSTKGRYALRVMTDLADNYNKGYVSLKDIALRQEISVKYLESIISDLIKSNLIISQHGKYGGYKLAKSPDLITAKDVIIGAEGELIPVFCSADSSLCKRSGFCKTYPVWKDFYKLVNDYFEGITLEDILKK